MMIAHSYLKGGSQSQLPGQRSSVLDMIYSAQRIRPTVRYLFAGVIIQSGNALFLGNRGETACPVSRLNIETGSRTGWKTFSPPDVAGIVGVACPRIAADEEHYGFGYIRNLSDLFLVERLR
jgi:hypothetical protein